MEPLVSVIVPVYNVLPWLREALDSLVGQTYSPLDIILVDDGSTDGSGAVCDEYAQERPELIRVFHQENRGLSGARNTGLDRMKGEIDVEASIAAGDFGPVNKWMTDHVFARADILPPQEWIRDITGRSFTPDDFLDYLEDKYSAIYLG